jgi:hypothetical protein
MILPAALNCNRWVCQTLLGVLANHVLINMDSLLSIFLSHNTLIIFRVKVVFFYFHFCICNNPPQPIKEDLYAVM